MEEEIKMKYELFEKIVDRVLNFMACTNGTETEIRIDEYEALNIEIRSFEQKEEN